MCYFSEMTYLRWCRPFRYKHYFSNLYNLPIKMCFCQEIQQHVPSLQERKSFSHFIQFWPVILPLKWLSGANTGWASVSATCLSHLHSTDWMLPCTSYRYSWCTPEICMNWAEYVSSWDLINNGNNSNYYDCCRPQAALLFWAPQKASKIGFPPESL